MDLFQSISNPESHPQHVIMHEKNPPRCLPHRVKFSGALANITDAKRLSKGDKGSMTVVNSKGDIGKALPGAPLRREIC